nr:MAG TPA: hypothetical protein [Caudoviricetes sp.]
MRWMYLIFSNNHLTLLFLCANIDISKERRVK